VEIAILRLHPDGREEFLRRRMNPGMPIPAEAKAVHGISDGDVEGRSNSEGPLKLAGLPLPRADGC
jgi:DNA polymerase-3 subunit epsilon